MQDLRELVYLVVDLLNLHHAKLNLLLARFLFGGHLFVLLLGINSFGVLLANLLEIEGRLLGILKLLFSHIMLPERLVSGL